VCVCVCVCVQVFCFVFNICCWVVYDVVFQEPKKKKFESFCGFFVNFLWNLLLLLLLLFLLRLCFGKEFT
jgi:hypothetical protein